jgi:DNA invertase Pin-like site-specific DNA recombinase
MPNVYGYVRVSTRSQNYNTQVDAIKKFCLLKDYTLVKIFEDKESGKNTERKGYQDMIKTLESNPQDVKIMIVTKMDRVGRSIRDLLKFIDFLGTQEIGFVSLDNNIDTTTKEGRLVLYIFGAIAEYERELILERTETGRIKYVSEGGKLGRVKLKLPTDEIKRLIGEGVPKTEVARRLRVSVPTIYSRLSE